MDVKSQLLGSSSGKRWHIGVRIVFATGCSRNPKLQQDHKVRDHHGAQLQQNHSRQESWREISYFSPRIVFMMGNFCCVRQKSSFDCLQLKKPTLLYCDAWLRVVWFKCIDVSENVSRFIWKVGKPLRRLESITSQVTWLSSVSTKDLTWTIIWFP